MPLKISLISNSICNHQNFLKKLFRYCKHYLLGMESELLAKLVQEKLPEFTRSKTH